MIAPFTEFSQNFRSAVRSLRRAPRFTALAVLTLAIGIGANTAIFSVIDATLLRPLPFAEPDRLMRLALRMPRDRGAEIDMTWSYPKFLAFNRDQNLFSHTALYMHQSVTIGGTDGGERVPGEAISARYLELLGVRQAFGANITWKDDGTESNAVVFLGQDYWRRRFGGEPRVIGAPLEVNGRVFVVAGILPAGFRGLTGRSDVWMPIPAIRASSMTQAAAHQYEMVARLRPEVPPTEGKRMVRALGAQITATFPEAGSRWGAAAYTFDEVRLDPRLRQAIPIIGGAVIVLLIITCVNIAGLLLARGAERRREIAIRLAIGATRGRVLRQHLTESLLLVSGGAAAGAFVAWIGVRALRAVVPDFGGDYAGAFAEDVSALTAIGLGGIRIDYSALAFTAAISVLAGLLFGVLPALRDSRSTMVQAMKIGGFPEPSLAGMRRLTPRGILVVAEVSLAVVLLVGAGLVARSLGKLLDVPAGFNADQVLTARVSMSGTRYAAATAEPLWSVLLERLRALPGVDRVGVATCAPVSTECEGTSIEIGPGTEVPVGLHGASPGYFAALRIPLLAGRDFTGNDRSDAPRVLIVNEAAVNAHWGGASPVGRRIVFWGDTAEIVGIVGDVRYDRLEEQVRPSVYLPFAQRPFSSAMVFLRTSADPGLLAGPLRREIRRVDPGHAMYDIKSMTTRVGDAASRTRFSALLLGVFAAVALLLAAVGIYGVMAIAVAQRTREIGIRLAVGATVPRVVAMVMGQAMLLAGMGGLIGLALAVVASRALRAILFGIGPLDPVTYGVIVSMLGVAAIAATIVPARRAARVSVIEAIRSE